MGAFRDKSLPGMNRGVKAPFPPSFTQGMGELGNEPRIPFG
jgi:hypothetical protein